MGANTGAKRKLIRKFGNKCFIEELGLRTKEEVAADLARYKSKKKRAIMDELTYHHIVERFKGGKATEANGAFLRNINHQWFNRLSSEQQAAINKLFQQYKAQVYEECDIVLVDQLPTTLTVKAAEIAVTERGRLYNRAKEKEKTRKAVQSCEDYIER